MIKSKIRQVFNFSIDDAGDKGKHLPVYSDIILYFAGSEAWMCLAWIGGFRDVHDLFRWTESNQIVNYTNWSPSNPNNHGGNERCVQVYKDGSWNDLICNTRIPYICEKKLN